MAVPSAESTIAVSVPAELAAVLPSETFPRYDPYRGVDVPIEVIVTGITLSSDVATVLTSIGQLRAFWRHCLAWLRQETPERTDRTRLAITRSGTKIDLDVEGDVDPDALKDAVMRLLEAPVDGRPSLGP
jgi:hypothetical protein